MMDGSLNRCIKFDFLLTTESPCYSLKTGTGSLPLLTFFVCVSYFHFDTSDVITKQLQLQCVDINKLYNISCYDRKVNTSHCTYL